MSLAFMYFKRLKLDPITLDQDPTFDKLCRIVQAHLEQIPFENLAQHGAVGGLPTVDMTVTARKILVRKRGGICMELNGLLAELLKELGYQVIRVPAYVYSTAQRRYFSLATHVFLMVQTQDDQLNKWFVDVGFGEPALQPLQYELETVQETVEGMISRFVLLEPEEHQGDNVEDGESQTNHQDDVRFVGLQWKTDSGWEPRLKWDSTVAFTVPDDGQALDYLSPALERVLEESSIFSRKLICCRLTRNEKITLAGNTLKQTGPPRFAADGNDDDDPTSMVPITTTELKSVQEVREALQSLFGIPLEETEGLDLSRSLDADPNIWSHTA